MNNNSNNSNENNNSILDVKDTSELHQNLSHQKQLNAQPTSNNDNSSKSHKGPRSRHATLLLIFLGSISAISGLLVTMPNTFMVQELHNRQASTLVISTMLAIYSLAALFTAPIAGWIGNTTRRRRRTLFLSLPCWAISSLVFGLFLTPFNIGISLRCIQGLIGATTTTVTYGLIADLFEGNHDHAMSIIQATNGFFYIVGPAVGGVLYQSGGFYLPFALVFALGLFDSAVLVFFFDKLIVRAGLALCKTSSECDNISIKLEKISLQNEKPWWTTITYGFIIMSVIPLVLTTGLGFAQPLFTLYVQDELKIDNKKAGFVYAIYGVAFTVTSSQVAKVTKIFGRRIVIVCGLLTGCLGFLLTGPVQFIDHILHERSANTTRWILLVLSRSLSGMGVAAAFVPSLPALLNRAKTDKVRLGRGFGDVVGPCSGLWACLTAVGNLLGSALGPWMKTQMSFYAVLNIAAIVYAMFAAILLLFIPLNSIDSENFPSKTPERRHTIDLGQATHQRQAKRQLRQQHEHQDKEDRRNTMAM